MLTNAQMKPYRFQRWADARRKFRWIEEMFADGRAVYVCTYTREIKCRSLDCFQLRKDGVYLRRGKKWDCITGAGLYAE